MVLRNLKMYSIHILDVSIGTPFETILSQMLMDWEHLEWGQKLNKLTWEQFLLYRGQSDCQKILTSNV